MATEKVEKAPVAAKAKKDRSPSKFGILRLNGTDPLLCMKSGKVDLILDNEDKPFTTTKAADEYIESQKVSGPCAVVCFRSLCLAAVQEVFKAKKLDL